MAVDKCEDDVDQKVTYQRQVRLSSVFHPHLVFSPVPSCVLSSPDVLRNILRCNGLPAASILVTCGFNLLGTSVFTAPFYTTADEVTCNRKLNLVIFGLPETTANATEHEIQNIFRELNEKPVVSSTKRNGEKTDNCPRPVIVTLERR